MTMMTGLQYAGYIRRMPPVPALNLFPFIAAMAPASRGTLEGFVAPVSCKAGTPLVARGDEVAGAYLVEEGALRVYYTSEEGREGTLYWIEPGQSCILALNCTFSRLAYPAWVESRWPNPLFDCARRGLPQAVRNRSGSAAVHLRGSVGQALRVDGN